MFSLKFIFLFFSVNSFSSVTIATKHCNGRPEYCYAPLTKTLMLGAHNAFSIKQTVRGKCTKTIKIPVIGETEITKLMNFDWDNQDKEIDHLLAHGVRFFDIDTCYWDGKATFGELINSSRETPKKGYHNCHGECKEGKGDNRFVKSKFDRIKNFLDSNLDEFIVLQFGDMSYNGKSPNGEQKKSIKDGLKKEIKDFFGNIVTENVADITEKNLKTLLEVDKKRIYLTFGSDTCGTYNGNVASAGNNGPFDTGHMTRELDKCKQTSHAFKMLDWHFLSTVIKQPEKGGQIGNHLNGYLNSVCRDRDCQDYINVVLTDFSSYNNFPQTLRNAGNRAIQEFFEYKFSGCFIDNDDRIMNGGRINDGLTSNSCAVYCRNLGMDYFGLQNGDECFCDSLANVHKFSKHGRVSSIECSKPCVSDSSKKCGGTWKMAIYALTPITESVPVNVDSSPQIKTENNCECEIPFRYNDNEYWGCTSQDHYTDWCFTKGTNCGFKGDHGNWDECAPTEVPGFKGYTKTGCLDLRDLGSSTISLYECHDLCSNDKECMAFQFTFTSSLCERTRYCTAHQSNPRLLHIMTNGFALYLKPSAAPLEGGLLKIAALNAENKCLDFSFPQQNVLYMYGCHGNSNQKWKIDVLGRIISEYDHMCIEAHLDNNSVYMQECHYRENQQWYFSKTSDGKYRITNKMFDPKVLDYNSNENRFYINDHASAGTKFYFE